MNDTDSADMSDDDDFGLDNDLTTANSNEQTPIIIEDLTTAIDISVPEELQQFDSSKFAQDLLSKVGTSDFQTCLYQHWRRYTPLCYTYHPNLVKGMIELRAQDILFRPLEIFLYGTQDTENAIQTIKGLNNPPTVCGHLFKSEEPTYFCRDCCVDATCVLCTECFLQSEHRKHRYKMNVSAGGGYCDCGDTEAWKQDVHCALHKPKNDQEQDNNDILERLPNLLKIRAGLLFEVLLNFSVQLLCCGDYQETPVVLRNDDWDGNHDRYVTMLFNDEIHTYDQVIAVLTRSISCSKQEGHEYASVVDREGRTAVRCGNLEQCQEVQQMIMHHTVDIPLKCRVYPKCFVSLQYFAQKLMLYMQEVIAISDGFRRLFCLCEMNAKDQLTLTERILLAENVLWKSAKSVLHQIFINSFFMDSEWKKTFAILYMKNYSTIWRNYVKDHDEYVSFTDLSVQVYTVPSLARYLISSHNAFQTIVEAFLEYCRKKLNSQEKLLFLRTTTSMVQNEFRRAQSILYDLKYLLGIVPTQYTPELRENFLNGFTSFLRLLSYMHGMDKVVRQVGQHIEFEPEWETGFNIVIKIQTIIQSILEWCSQDPELSQKAYVKTGETLASMQQNSDISHMIKKDASPIVKISVHDHKIECYSYDVQKDPISVHIPVARLLAAIYIHLQRYTDPTATFHNLCQQYKIYPCFFYEEALRIQVLSAQHIAGLWRRNGYSLSNQLYFYSNIKCRKEMYDRDILALQIGASLTQPNTFLVQLLHKFGLLEWVRSPENGYSTETETKTREKVRIMEEFLHLLIIILGERYEPYVGQVMKDEKLKREIIHQLCTGPLPHSELVRNFTDSGQEVGTVDLESVLKETADFKKLSHTSKGHYELKNDCLIDYNPFYYHYTKADQCRSEEYVLKRRKILGLSSLLLIPSPPAFYDSFQSIIQLLQCDIFLTLIKAVLHRTIDQKAELWSEAILIRALHLITLALFEEERSFHKQQTLSSNVSSHNFQFCENSQKYGIEKLLTQLTTATKAETCKEFVSHILKSFNKFNEKQNVRDEQSSSLTVSQDFTNDTNKKAQKEKRRKELAAQKRAKIIAQMTALQKNFMEGNKDLFDEAHISTGNDSLSPSLPSSLIATPVLLGTESGMTESMDTNTNQVFQSCLGTTDLDLSSQTNLILTCIFCQENSEVRLNSDAIVLPAYIESSRTLSKNRLRKIENPDTFDPSFMSNDLYWGIHVSSCGHAIHASCWIKYHDSVLIQDQRRVLRMRGATNYDVERGEFLCPLCQTLSNTVIPVLPYLRSFAGDIKLTPPQMSYKDWLDGLEKALNGSIESRYEDESHEEQLFFNPCPLSSITKMMAETVAFNFQLLFGFAGGSKVQEFSDSIRERITTFGRSIYTLGLNVDPDDDNDRVPTILWTSCAYTIQTIENLLRIDSKSILSPLPLRQTELISALVKVAAVNGLLHDIDKIKKHCLKLLSVLLPSRVRLQVPSLSDVDLFHLLVSLCFTIPILFTNEIPRFAHVAIGNLNDLYLMRLILTAHCLQILSSHNFIYQQDQNISESLNSDTINTDDDEEIEAINSVVQRIVQSQNNQSCQTSSQRLLSGRALREKLKLSLLPLLRCSAIFYHYLTGIAWPTISTTALPDSPSEYTMICQYLGLPNCLSKILNQNNDNNLNDLVNSLTSSDTITSRDQINTVPLIYPMEVNELYPLPKEYIDLMNQVSQGVAPYKYARDETRSPCICLICGEIVVRSSQTNRQTSVSSLVTTNHPEANLGPCYLHTLRCCGSVGLYLRVKECSLLVLNITDNGRGNKARGTLIPTPYLDDYGETDQNLRRGNPLHLCEERYHLLHRRWLSHTYPEDISRNMELSASVYATNWTLF